MVTVVAVVTAVTLVKITVVVTPEKRQWAHIS